jgi:hypothetical protein
MGGNKQKRLRDYKMFYVVIDGKIAAERTQEIDAQLLADEWREYGCNVSVIEDYLFILDDELTYA